MELHLMNVSVDRKEKMMLKIKDNIDLKELRKFRFKECRDYFYYEKATIRADICVNKRSKTISLLDFFGNIDGRKRDRRTETLKEIEIVKDLIQAGLVEKI